MSLKVTVKVPATTANLGPGFDALGMALDLWNTFEIEWEDDNPPNGPAPGTLRVGGVTVQGEGLEVLPADENNLVFKAMKAGFAGEELPRGRVNLRITNRVPLASGLGSSATAIVAGLLAGNALRKEKLSQDQLIETATRIEGHPDNVAPALLGGLVVSVVEEGGPVRSLSVPVPDELWICVAVPDFYLDTRYSRAKLPERVTRQDAVFNLSRSALWVAAMARGDLSALRVATQDVLHQPYRSALIPGLDDVFAAALGAGAVGVALSGSGPSVTAFCRQFDAALVGEAMSRAFRKVGVTTRTWTVRPATTGATVEVAACPGGESRDPRYECNLFGGV